MTTTPNPTAEAVAKVRELHRPVEIEPSSTICHECSHQLPSGDYAEKVTEWPCATLDALAAALAAQPVLDPEKVTKVVCDAIEGNESDTPYDMVAARAICEAAKRGELNADR